MFGIGFPELVVILLIAFLVLGPEKIMTFSRSMGRIVAELKRKTEKVEEAVFSELRKVVEEPTKKNSLKETENDVQSMEKRKKS